MPDPHDLTLLSIGRDLQAVRKTVALNHQGMVARGRKRIGHAFEKIFSVMPHQGSFPVHHPVIDHDVASKNMADALVPQTDAQGGYLRTEAANNLIR